MSLPTDGYINEDSLEKINGGANTTIKYTDKALHCPLCQKAQKFIRHSGGRAQCPSPHCRYQTEA